MCGINLIVSKNKDDLQPVLRKMLATTSFRGPDAEGEIYKDWGKGSLALGANRLMIIDSDENSNQPMVSNCGNYLLAFNGEIYNYQDLKSVLIGLGQEFRTHSDTEVVLYWLKHHGTNGLGQLMGMFALVFIDLRQEKILVARDSHGIKPLFSFSDENNLVVSSSLKALVGTGLIQKKINQRTVQEYLSFRHVLGTKTFYKDVEAVEPGTFVEYSTTSSETGSFYVTQEESSPKDLKEALIDAVTLTSTAKSNPALLLSGGVDSTLLLAILRQELGYRGAPTFTLNTDPKETAAAEKAARKFDSTHKLVEITEEDVERSLDFLDLMDQPIADHGALATWLISEKVGEEHKILLSGAGADEHFGGYNRHLALYRYQNNKGFWFGTSKIASKLGYVGLPKQLKTYLSNIREDTWTTFQNFLKIHGIEINDQIINDNNQNDTPVENLADALEFDQRNYLINDVLAITDLATMSHGVEARVPYLYDPVVQAARNIPTSEKMHDKGKGPLKRLLRQYGGGAFAGRPKMGFGLPMGRWLRDSNSVLWSLIGKDDPVFEYVNEETFNTMQKEQLAGKKDWNMQLWSILVLSHWLKNNFS